MASVTQWSEQQMKLEFITNLPTYLLIYGPCFYDLFHRLLIAYVLSNSTAIVWSLRTCINLIFTNSIDTIFPLNILVPILIV